MAAWKPIEKIDFENPIWVLKYDIFFKSDGNFCDATHPEAVKFTSCHGYYDSEEDAEKVRRHFPHPEKYRTEKVHKRVLNV